MLIRPISYITNIVTNDNSYNKYPKYYSNPSFLAKYDAVASFKNKSKNCTINHIYPKQKYTLEYVFSDTDIENMRQLSSSQDLLEYQKKLISEKKYSIKKVPIVQKIYNTKFLAHIGNITDIKVDAIVNAAHQDLLGGDGVDGHIHKVAGPELLEECRTFNGCDIGKAKITLGYNLPAKYVIHAVGPKWQGGNKNEANLLKSCYINALNIAKNMNIRTIAIPAISCGVHGYPIEKGVKIAYDSVQEFVKENPCFEEIIFIDTNPDVIKEFEKLINKAE